MLDIRLVREKPDFVRERLATRGGGDEAKIDDLLQIDFERRKAQTALQQLNAERNRFDYVFRRADSHQVARPVIRHQGSNVRNNFEHSVLLFADR